ncbi:hypothetical protein K469DRAFT_688413 [Zopfia rhizophila CBS 207.26]|uniref:Uncharacterized protein n=1 Tax=Zopfia rhizophila CBS 207.26 TaxID=1314779 RepID=A0A6A6DZ15_9PEZI|nr:hypothetical protein K469DRAFT_688413 [Zopfia rhizophila CBS 207.26]
MRQGIPAIFAYAKSPFQKYRTSGVAPYGAQTATAVAYTLIFSYSNTLRTKARPIYIGICYSAASKEGMKAEKAKKAMKKKTALLAPSPPPPALPSGQPEEPIFIVGEDEDVEQAVECEGEYAGTPTPPPPARFTSVWKAVAASGRETLPGTKSAVFNADNLFLYLLEDWKD